MYIKRLTVENEGFLAGADIEFSPGLNVIIGARGTGKTSVIELIRYCLGAGGFTDDAVERGSQQARAILQGGAISIELDGLNGPQLFTRSSNGHLTGTTGTPPRCTVLAQNEVEAVGAQALGRIHLIDRYRDLTKDSDNTVESLSVELRSLTSQIQNVLAEGSNLTQQVKDADAIAVDLHTARAAQQQLLSQARASDADRNELARLEEASNHLAARSALLNDTLASVEALSRQLEGILESTIIPILPDDAGDDPNLEKASLHIANAIESIRSGVSQLANASRRLDEVVAADSDARRKVDESSRRLRQTLDVVQSGVGIASRRVQELEERLGQVTALTARLQNRRARYVEVRSKRDATYERLDAARERTFVQRDEVASRINAALGPQIRATVMRSARLNAYEAAIISSLRGTGIHYNTLAPLIARSISPFELCKWAEEANIAELTSSLEITDERAITIVSALRQRGTPDIIACEIEDDVVFELLDGREYKSTDRLSIGQRCTVILPVLLGQHGDPLLVDQPEDHLDNAFVADTLVMALNRRSPDDQFIFTSHNANIPVLGEADRVIVMDSDGDRGYVPIAGDLDDPRVVKAINRIMEGGKEAFARRSSFYAHGRTR